ncbi:MAG: phage tail tape measure protein [Devosia sp.]
MTGRLAKMSGALSRFQAKNRAIAGSFFPGGNLRTLVGAVASYQAITGSIRGTVGAAMGFESAMADVKKVVSASPREFKGLERSVLGLSKRLPVAASGLADIMANAGQSGIATKNLTAFTELTAKSAVAFGMSTAQIADIFPKLKNVFELDIAGLRGLPLTSTSPKT